MQTPQTPQTPETQQPEATPTRNPRRRWFKGLAIGGIVATLAAGLGWKAFAHERGWHRGHWSGPVDPARVDAHVDRMLRHFYAEVDATEEQKQKLGPIVKAAAKDLLPMREKLREARGRAHELLDSGVVDRAAIERLRAEQVKLADDGSRRLTQALADAAEVLTPAQRKGIAGHLGRFAGSRG